MPAIPSVLVLLLDAVVLLGLGGVAAHVWRHRRSEPSARPFLALLIVVALVASANAGRMELGLFEGDTWSSVYLLLALGVAISWLVFTIKYTGRGDILTPRRATLVVLPLVPMVVRQVVEHPVLDLFAALSLVYLLSIMGIGVFLVLRSAVIFHQMPLRQAGAIVLGPTVPFFLGFLEDALMDLAPVLSAGEPLVLGLVVGLLGFGLSIGRYRMFASVPGVQAIARDQVIDQMGEGVLVVDQNDRVIDLNPVLKDAFDSDTPAAFGQSVEAIIGVDVATVREDNPVEIETPDGSRRFEVTVSSITDGGQVIGHTLVLRDVTERETREQRLQVLNRVLRHNLRNDLNTVNGYAELLEEKTSNPGDYAGRIQETATDLIAIGEKAREIETVVAAQRRPRTALLSDIVQRAVEEVQTAYPDCTIPVESPAEDTRVNEPILRSVLRELIENGAEHNDADQPWVEVEATFDAASEYPLTITVTDNGPGIPDHELTPIREGTETALEHGSGFGLWLVEWGVRRLDGQIKFGENDPRGAVAMLRLRSAS